MDALLIVTTLAWAWLPVHWHLTKSDWPQLCEWIRHWLKPLDKDQQKEQRVEEEMMKLRQRNYKWLRRVKLQNAPIRYPKTLNYPKVLLFPQFDVFRRPKQGDY